MRLFFVSMRKSHLPFGKNCSIILLRNMDNRRYFHEYHHSQVHDIGREAHP